MSAAIAAVSIMHAVVPAANAHFDRKRAWELTNFMSPTPQSPSGQQPSHALVDSRPPLLSFSGCQHTLSMTFGDRAWFIAMTTTRRASHGFYARGAAVSANSAD